MYKMGKKSVSWPDFLKIKFQEIKKSKPALQFKELLQDVSVKTEWKKITDGTHSEYEKGAMTRKAKKVKTDKSPSASSSSSSKSSGVLSDEMHSYEKISAQSILDDCDLCKKCTKKIHEYLHRNIGGDSSPATVAESNQGALVQQAKATVAMHSGGGTRKSKKKRGGSCGPCGVFGGGGKKRKSRKRK